MTFKVEVKSKRFDIDPASFQPVITWNLTLASLIEAMQDINAKNINELKMLLGEAVYNALENFKE